MAKITVTLELDGSLHKDIRTRAKTENRSIEAEILTRLTRAYYSQTVVIGEARLNIRSLMTGSEKMDDFLINLEGDPSTAFRFLDAYATHRADFELDEIIGSEIGV
jgi:plasmid stability protein